MREEVSNKVFIGLHASLATLEKKGKSAWLGFLSIPMRTETYKSSKAKLVLPFAFGGGVVWYGNLSIR